MRGRARVPGTPVPTNGGRLPRRGSTPLAAGPGREGALERRLAVTEALRASTLSPGERVTHRRRSLRHRRPVLRPRRGRRPGPGVRPPRAAPTPPAGPVAPPTAPGSRPACRATWTGGRLPRVDRQLPPGVQGDQEVDADRRPPIPPVQLVLAPVPPLLLLDLPARPDRLVAPFAPRAQQLAEEHADDADQADDERHPHGHLTRLHIATPSRSSRGGAVRGRRLAEVRHRT